MGLTCAIRSATSDQIEALSRWPMLLPAFFEAASLDEVRPAPTLWQRIRGRAPQIPAALHDLSNCMEIDLEKAWHGLHFLFTGTAYEGDEPACFLLKGGRAIRWEDIEARALSPDEVERFRELVHALPEEALRKRYDPETMTRLEIYPEIIWMREGEEALDYLLEYHQQLWAFLRDAAEEKQGCVIWIA